MCPAMEGCKMSPLSTSSNLNINMEKKYNYACCPNF